MKKHLCHLLAATIAVLASGYCLAIPPSIESLSLPILQVGQEAQIEIVGAGMNQVSEMVFYSPEVHCSKIVHLDDYKLTATLKANADSAIKSHAFRLRGEDGFSELRTIRVNRYPIIREQQRARVGAEIELDYQNQTIAGTLQSGDYDRYAIPLKNGQRLTVEAEAMRLGSVLLDCVLKVYDPQGNLWMHDDDSSILHQDPSVSFEAPQDGRYIVEIHESNYAGSNDSHYALHLGSFPANRIAFPAGGQEGTEVLVQFIEANSPASAISKLPSQLFSLPTNRREYLLFAGQAESLSASPILFRVSRFPNAFEQEPNEAIDSLSQSHSIPVAFNGILQTNSDIDCFAFDASQGQSLQIDVYADRIGSPIDSYLQLYNPIGQLIATSDDCDSNDSRIDFVVPENGRYVLQLRDKLNRGSSNGVYRVEVSASEPQLTTFLPRPDRLSQRQQTITVPQGNRTLAKVAVKRENIDGEVQLRFVDLPAGVHSTPVYIPANEYWAIAILEADVDAKTVGALSGLQATAQTNQRIVEGNFKQTVDLIAESADRLYQAIQVDRLAVAVTPAMPFRIEIEQPRAILAVDGSIDLVVRLIRDTDFDIPVRVEFPYLPDGCIGESFIVIDGNSSEAKYRITASPNTPEANFKLAAIATVSLTEGRARVDQPNEKQNLERASEKLSKWKDLKEREVASNMVELRIGPNPTTGHFLNLAAERGEAVSVACVLRFTQPVPSSMECRLEGLPNRVTAEPIKIESSQSQAVFDLKVAEDAPVGAFRGIQCRLTGKLDGSAVSFIVPSTSELIIAEPGKLLKDKDGRVLSPLEALRKQNEK